MKVLYVVNAYDNKHVDFYAAQVLEETKDKFITLDKIRIENYVHEFPKNLLNFEFEWGYVTNKLDKKVLKTQINRIYNKLRQKYLDGKELFDLNELYHKTSIDLLEELKKLDE